MSTDEKKEHRIIEQAWLAIGPHGAVAAAIAIMAIYNAAGWEVAAWTVVAGIGAAAIWCLGMKVLIWTRPNGYRD
jgi:hypothetical protein